MYQLPPSPFHPARLLPESTQSSGVWGLCPAGLRYTTQSSKYKEVQKSCAPCMEVAPFGHELPWMMISSYEGPTGDPTAVLLPPGTRMGGAMRKASHPNSSSCRVHCSIPSLQQQAISAATTSTSIKPVSVKCKTDITIGY